jgi:dimethylamine monooxygenase subunit A
LLPYFPFKEDSYKMSMGVQALYGSLIEVENTSYLSEIKLKNALLHDTYDRYFQALPGTERLQWEAIEVLLPHMASHYSHYFALTIDGMHWTWRNTLLKEETQFVLGEQNSLPLPPLDWLGRQVQEDLLILDGSKAEGTPLVAGQLCFPNAWCLEDKLGQSFLDIHTDVPQFEKHLGRSSTLLLERLKPERAVWRVNWAFKSLSRLNLTPHFYHEVQQSYQQLTKETIGKQCMLRIERQVLVRLPRTHDILFTIHTYQDSIENVTRHAEDAYHIANVLRTTPKEMLVYKGISPFIDLLLGYLDSLVDIG